MKMILLAAASIGVAAAAALGAAQGAQEPAPPKKTAKEHEILASWAGTWTFKAKFEMGPGKTMESTGVQTDTLGCDGLWLFMDSKEEKKDGFQGHGMVGYDTEKKKYVSAWVDSMSTKIDVVEGVAEKDGKAIRMTHEVPGADGKPVKMTRLFELKDKDARSLTFFVTGADGKETPIGVIEYVRKK